MIDKKTYDFLINHLDLTKEAIDFAVSYSDRNNEPMSICLWKFGIISLDQLNFYYNWKYK